MCEELILSDHDEPSPSKSTTTESQVTVRSSPVVPETVPVCRQCHKKCLSNILSSSELSHSCANQRNNNHAPAVGVAPAPANPGSENDWQSFLLLGICANPVASLVKYDPFKTPEISVAPPTPENSVISDEGEKPRLCLTNGTCDDSMENRQGSAAQTSDDDSPQTEEHPYHSLSNSVQTLRRFGTLSSLEQFGSEAPDDAFETNCSSEESLDEDDECLGLDNEAFNHTSIMSWTARAGSFVAEKMAFFEKLDYRSGGGFFDRYLKSPEELKVNGDEAQEEETSGGTSGEEVWGTPTSGDLDDPLFVEVLNVMELNFPQPNESYSSDNMDDTELMMDELLMAPPITGAILRGLLPRRTLEPLIEEDFSDSSSSPSTSEVEVLLTHVFRMLPQSHQTGGRRVPTCAHPSRAAGAEALRPPRLPRKTPANQPQPARVSPRSGEKPRRFAQTTRTARPSPNMPRSESYRKIVEAAEDAVLEAADSSRGPPTPVLLFRHFRPAAKFASIERIPRTKSIRIFEFFNVRRTERRIYEKYPANALALKTFQEADDSDSAPSSDSPSKTPSKELKAGRRCSAICPNKTRSTLKLRLHFWFLLAEGKAPAHHPQWYTDVAFRKSKEVFRKASIPGELVEELNSPKITKLAALLNNIGGRWQVKEMATYADTVIEERKESVVDISGDLQEFIKRVAAEVDESSTTVYTSPQIPLPKINVGDPAYVKAADLSARDVERANFVFSIYDFEGNGTVDAVNLGDMLRALNLNPTLATIEKLGGTKKKNEKKLKVDEFLPIYSQVKKDKEQGNFDDFLEALKLYDKEENGTMMAAELAHTLLSLGERLSDVETDQVIADCLDKEDDEGFVPYELDSSKSRTGFRPIILYSFQSTQEEQGFSAFWKATVASLLTDEGYYLNLCCCKLDIDNVKRTIRQVLTRSQHRLRIRHPAGITCCPQPSQAAVPT
ncbi:hypothetical protein HUJ05_011451 [Dendroctonus ponderosae]|nr:hypothetical protein HUJ05_011451 [Dendroctonus ponderosae]